MKDEDDSIVARHTPPPTQEAVVDHLVIQVDRLKQTNKLLKWAVATAVTFALGAAGTVGRMLYGMGADDQVVRHGIERAQRQADENKADLRELQRFVYRRFGVDTTRPSPLLPSKDELP